MARIMAFKKGNIPWNKGLNKKEIIIHYKNGFSRTAGMLGRKHSKEARKKMSESWEYNKHITEGRNKKISESCKGHIVSEETRNKISKTRMGYIPWMKGKHHTKETKWKMSKIHEGRIIGEEWRKKISEANKGKKRTDEVKKRLGDANRGSKCNFWRGGIAKNPYTIDWTETLKRSIRKRDHYTCQICGRIQSNRTFHVHHIDYDKNNNGPDNLITLCHPCHSKTTNNERAYWKKYFYRNNIEIKG